MLECVTGTGGDMHGSSVLKSLAFFDEEDESLSLNYDSKSAASSLDVNVGANNIRVKVWVLVMVLLGRVICVYYVSC
jgi:hypothetical protein